MMKEEVVNRKRWLTEAEFLDYLGATNLIPGPNSTELAIHIGHHRRGWLGLLVAGTSFILPAMMIVWLIAWAYTRYGSLPQVSGILYGIKPVVIAVVFQALWGLARTAIKSGSLAALGAVALILCIRLSCWSILRRGQCSLISLDGFCNLGTRAFYFGGYSDGYTCACRRIYSPEIQNKLRMACSCWWFGWVSAS